MSRHQRRDSARRVATHSDLHENIAAISAELWGGDSEFYPRHGANLGGFPGVWRFAIDAAKIFTEQERRFAATFGRKPRKPSASFEYLDAILEFAEWFADWSVYLPTDSEQAAKAWECILKASTVWESTVKEKP